MSLATSTPTKWKMPLLRSFGFGWRGDYKDFAPTALDAARLIFWADRTRKFFRCGTFQDEYSTINFCGSLNWVTAGSR